jgi:hypothetical protein
MSLLTPVAAEAPNASGQNLDYITENDSLFAGATRMDGVANAYDIDNNMIASIREIAQEGSDRLDSVFPATDLTKQIQQPVLQRHPPLIAEKAFPINPETKGFWGEAWDLLNLSDQGQAGFIKSSDDFSMVNLEGKTYKGSFVSIGIGYKMTYIEYKHQAISSRSINLERQKKRICELAMRQLAERVAFLGHAPRQLLGIANNPFIPRAVSPIAFDAAATPTQIKAVLRDAMDEGYLNSSGAAMEPDAIVGSRRKLSYLKKRTFSTTGDNRDSVFKASMEETNINTNFLFPTTYMDKFGPANEAAFFFYKRDPGSISWHYPVAMEWLPPFLYNGFEVIHLCIGRIGSVWPEQPEDCLLLTGI